MASPFGRWMMALAAAGYLAGASPGHQPARAQQAEDRRAGWNDDDRWRPPHCRDRDGRDRIRCERERDRWERSEREDRRRREWERKRRDDARAKGVATGVVGAVVVGGIIAAIASSGDKKKKARERRRYCEDRYGNYDERTDSYRADNGQWYRCE